MKAIARRLFRLEQPLGAEGEPRRTLRMMLRPVGRKERRAFTCAGFAVR